MRREVLIASSAWIGVDRLPFGGLSLMGQAPVGPVALRGPRGLPRRRLEADPGPALKIAEANGFTVLGKPRRQPKHVKILGFDLAGDAVELHIERDRRLRKTRPVHEADRKWGTEIVAGRCDVSGG